MPANSRVCGTARVYGANAQGRCNTCVHAEDGLSAWDSKPVLLCVRVKPGKNQGPLYPQVDRGGTCAHHKARVVDVGGAR
jgi:hypothetical protein